MNTCLWEPEALTEGRVTEWIVEWVWGLEDLILLCYI